MLIYSCQFGPSHIAAKAHTIGSPLEGTHTLSSLSRETEGAFGEKLKGAFAGCDRSFS